MNLYRRNNSYAATNYYHLGDHNNIPLLSQKYSRSRFILSIIRSFLSLIMSPQFSVCYFDVYWKLSFSIETLNAFKYYLNNTSIIQVFQVYFISLILPPMPMLHNEKHFSHKNCFNIQIYTRTYRIYNKNGQKKIVIWFCIYFYGEYD